MVPYGRFKKFALHGLFLVTKNKDMGVSSSKKAGHEDPQESWLARLAPTQQAQTIFRKGPGL